MSKILLLFFLISYLVSHSQMLSGIIPGRDATFSNSFISKSKIKTIKIDKAVKKDNGRIENTGNITIFYFNAMGMVAKKIIISVNAEAILDTIFEFNYYNKQQQLINKRTFSANLIRTIYYTYDTLGYPIKIVNCKETNMQSGMEFFQLGKQEVLSVDNFYFEKLNANQIKKMFLNDEGRIYKEGIMYYDSSQNLIEENYRYVATNVRINYKYTFNKKNQLIEYAYYSDAAGEYTEKTVYTYEESGNLLKLNYSGTHKPAGEIFYFHNKVSKQLEASLTKNPTTGALLIEKYSIETY